MNNAEKQKLSTRYNRATLVFEKALFRRMSAEINKTTKRIAIEVARRQYLPSRTQLEHQQRIEKILEPLYKRVIPKFADFGLENLKTKQFPLEKKNEFFDRLAELWIFENVAKKATLISTTTVEKIQQVIDKSIKNGDSVDEIAGNIRKTTALTASRSALIARTEVHDAANFASYESAVEAERELDIVMVKGWLPVSDGRTRPDHQNMSSHPLIKLDEYFTVGSSRGKRPHDSNLPAEEVINCRCTLFYEERTIDGL